MDEFQKPSYLEAIEIFNQDRHLRILLCDYEKKEGYRFIQHEFVKVICGVLEWEHQYKRKMSKEQFRKVVEKTCF